MEQRIISIDTPAFYALIKEVVSQLRKELEVSRKWIPEREAMEMLGIRSKTTLQKFRNEGSIRFTKIASKNILYDRFSIEEFLEAHSLDTF